MESITLVEALSVLAKSSPFSVTTINERAPDKLDRFKFQLFVEQDIERDLHALLTSLHGNEVIFLCGSSGDGKSEILTRCYYQYKDQIKFHLDATHSFAPRQSAIQALDELFDAQAVNDKPLLVGINTGMLANFSKEGDTRHENIKLLIERYLSGEFDNKKFPCHEDNCYFLDFEQYPKFKFNDGADYSKFAKTLMCNLTRRQEDNNFFRLAQNDEAAGRDLQVIANFKLLSLESVQDVIITQLFKARLIKDQFVTTRALLDLLHHLLLGHGYLFDNLFIGDQNELVQRLSDFDPARMHTQDLDQFVLRYELGLPNKKLDDFINTLAQQYIYFNRREIQVGDASSVIRLFCLLRDTPIGNNYHHNLSDNFRENSLEKYAQAWRLHTEYDGSNEKKMAMKPFYTKVLVAGIRRYANRNFSELSTNSDELFLGKFGEVKLSTVVDLKCDYEAILKQPPIKSSHFFAYLKMGEQKLAPILINLNLFELLDKLTKGYRPNKYDKNAIVLLDEVVEQISTQAKLSPLLKFYAGGRTYTAKQDDGLITINSLGGAV
jgi:DNA phosphorothioation-dependent restriction protein DptF